MSRLQEKEMSRLQEKGQYKEFITRTVYPVVDPLETVGWLFGGEGTNVETIAYPICQRDIEDLRTGKYDGHKYRIGNYPPQTVLIKHPFRPYELIPTDTDEHKIITDHLNDLVMIFKALGAKDCEATAKITKRETFKLKANGELKTPFFKVKGDFKETENKSIDSEYKLIIKREPGANNGYEIAHNIAEKHGLLEVREIDNIFRQFDSDIDGKDHKYQLSEVLTENYHKTIDAVLKINKTKAFSFHGKLNADTACRRTIRIDQTIYFE